MATPSDSHAAIGPLTDWMQANTTNIPVLPDLAVQLISIAADPDATISHLARIISKDQVLTTRLLSFANSAFCASAVEVTSVAEAVMRIGASGVRNLAVTVCFASRMQDRNIYGAHGRTLIDHGIGTAYLARLVAESADADTETAFLCGLLHDIGKLVILKWYYDVGRRTGHPVEPEIVEETMRHWHPTVAGMTFRRWNLPGDLDEPVMCHHDYQQATRDRRLAAVVYLANHLSHRYGFGCDKDGWDAMADPVMAELELDEGWLTSMDAKGPGLFAVARQILA